VYYKKVIDAPIVLAMTSKR